MAEVTGCLLHAALQRRVDAVERARHCPLAPGCELGLAAGAEAASEHPLARAVVAAALDRGLVPASAGDVQAVPGRGVTATAGTRRVQAGSLEWLAETGVDTSAADRPAADLADAGQTPASTVTGRCPERMRKGCRVRRCPGSPPDGRRQVAVTAN